MSDTPTDREARLIAAADRLLNDTMYREHPEASQMVIDALAMYDATPAPSENCPYRNPECPKCNPPPPPTADDIAKAFAAIAEFMGFIGKPATSAQVVRDWVDQKVEIVRRVSRANPKACERG